MTDALDAPTRHRTPFEALGGEAGVRRLVDDFYDAMEEDPAAARLRALHAADLAPMRARLADWLTGWMGGPRVYAERHPGRPCVVSAHKPVSIDGEAAEQWMACMRRALRNARLDAPWTKVLDEALAGMCEALRNDRPS